MGKLKLNKDGLKGMFINHVEKVVLVVVLLVFGLFVYSSLGLEGLPSGQTPDVLIKSAKDAEDKIAKPENASQVLAAVTIPTGYIERVDGQLKPTLADEYAIVHPPSPNYFPDGQKRLDPKLLPPEKVEVYSITSGLVYRIQQPDEDTFAKEKNSEMPKAEVKKAKPKKKTGYGSEGMSGMSSAPGYGAEEASSGGAMAGMPGMSSGAGMSGMMSSGGMPGMGGMEGMPGVAGGVMASPADRVGVLAGPQSVVKSRSIIAVKALVPWRKQWEEYRDKFSTSMGYNPQRDTPNYIWFNAERLEVTGDPQEELDWSKAKKINTKRVLDQLNAEGLYTFAPEVADPRYLFYAVLTFPVPPIVNRDLDKLALHSEVPKVNEAALAAMKAAKEKAEKKKKDDKKKAKEESDVPDAPAATAADGSGVAGGSMPGMAGMAGAAGMPGMSGGMPGMSGGMPGMSSGMGMSGMPGMSGGMPGMSGYGSESGGSSMMGMAGMGMPGMSGYNADGSIGGYGSESSSGMPGYGDMSSGMNVNPGPAVPYLLIRFFDMDVEPGKKYRYRVQVLMEDPNHPKFAQLDPSDRALDDTVKKRIEDEVTPAEKASKTKARKYYRYSDFSPPSDPIAVDVTSMSLAGEVSPLKTGNAPEKTQDKIVLEEPGAKMMSVMWDAVRATDVAGISSVFRGSYLNYKSKADAIHPVLLVFKSLEDYDFATNRMVADIRGGEELPPSATAKATDEPLITPGQYALIDETGQIVVRNEFDDWDQFRKLSLPRPVETIASTVPGEEGESGMMPGMSSAPGYGMPGSGGKKAKGKAARGSSSIAP